MNHKQAILSAITLAGFLTIFPTIATPATAFSKEKIASRSSELKTTRANKVVTAADREIERRVKALQSLIERINSMKLLTTDQKSALIKQVQAQIDSLNALKAKVDSETDPAKLKEYRKSIVDAYRIFVLYMPKITIMSHADRELGLVNKMTSVSQTLQTKIDTAKQSGKDVTSATAKMTDFQTHIADAKKHAQAAIDAVANLKPEDYPTNKTALTTAREELKQARTALNAAYSDLKAIRLSLKNTN